MSNVDERIVEMKFENHLFEKNVNTSIGTLEKLKNALKFNGVDKNLADLDKSVNSMDFSKLATGVDALNKRFSTMGIVGMTVIQDLTHAAENLGKKLYSGVIGQIKSGGWSRATNLAQAKFQIEGLGHTWDEVSDSINTAVDGTAYGLDAAAKAASQLLASGVALGDEMTNSLLAISGVAAMTNSTYEEISPIFTTVAGQGKLMTMQLRQLESRGLNAAAELGKQMGYTEQEIRDMVTAGKIGFKDFANAMNDAYGKHAKESNKTFTGALANMKSALSRIGAEFATPFQDNMILVFNALRTFINYIKKVKLPRVFADFSDFMSKASVLFAKTLAHVDLSWMDWIVDGLHSIYEWFDNLMGTISPVWKSLSTGAEEVSEAIEKVGLTLETVEDLAQRVLTGEFGNMEARWNAIDELTGIENAGLAVQNRVNELKGSAVRYAEAAEIVDKTVSKEQTSIDKSRKSLKDYAKAQEELKKFGKGILETLKAAFGEAEKASVFEWAATMLGGFKATLVVVGRTIMAVVKGALGPLIDIGKTIANVFGSVTSTIAEWVMDLSSYMQEFGGYARIQTIVNKAFKTFASILKTIGRVGLAAFNFLKTAISKVGDVILQAKDRFEEFTDAFKKTEAYKRIANAFDNVREKVTTLKNNITGPLRTAMKKFESMGIKLPRIDMTSFAQSVSDKIIWLLDKIDAIKEAIKGFFEGKMSGEGNIFSSIGEFFSNLSFEGALETFTNLINDAKEAVSNFFSVFASESVERFNSFREALLQFAGKVSGFFGSNLSSASEGIGGFGEAVQNAFGNFNLWDTVWEIIDKITKINAIRAFNGLLTGVSQVSGILKEARKTVKNFRKILKSVSKVGNAISRELNARALLEVAAAVGVFALSMKLLGSLSWDQFKVAAASIAVITGALTVLLLVLSKFSRKGAVASPYDGLAAAFKSVGSAIKNGLESIGKAATIFAIAYAIKTLVSILTDIKDMRWSDAKDGLKILGSIIAELAIAVIAINSIGNKASIGKALSIAALGLAVKMIADSMVKIGEMDESSFDQAIKAINRIALVLGGLMIASKGLAKKTLPLLALVAVIGSIAGSIALLSMIEPSKLSKSSNAMMKVILSLSAMIFALRSLAKLDIANVMGSTAMIGLLFGEIFMILEAMQSWDGGQLATMSDGLLKVMAGIALMAVAVSKLGELNIAQTGQGILGADLILADIVAIESIASGVQRLTNGKAADFINEGAPLLEAIAGALGRMVGALIGGGLAGFGDQFGDVPSQIKNFIDELKPVLEETYDIDTSGIDNIASVFWSLAKMDIAKAVENITHFLGSGPGGLDNSAEIKNRLVGFAETVKAYSTALTSDGGIDSSAIRASKAASDIAVSLMKEVPSTGGLWQKITGTKDYSGFSEGLVSFAKGLVGYAHIIANMKTDAVTATEDAVNIVTKLANATPGTGGLWQAIVGENNAADFGKSLIPFAQGMVTYAYVIARMNTEAVTATEDAVSIVTKLANATAPTGGLLQFINGETDAGSFGDKLVPFALGLVRYAYVINRMNTDAVSATQDAVSIVIALAGAIPDTTGGLMGKLFGNEMGSFNENLPGLGAAIKSFSENIAGADAGDAEKVIGTITQLASLFGQLGAEGNWLGAETVQQKLTEMETLVSGLFQQFTYALDDVEGMTDLQDALSNAGKYIGEQVSKGLAEGIKSTEGGTDLQNAFSEMIQKMINGTDGKAGDLTGLADSIVASLGTIGDAITTSLGADNLSATIIPELTAALTEMFATINSKQPIFRTAGNNLINALAGGVRAGRSWVTAALQAIGIAGFNAINAYQSRFRTAGRNMGAGLAGGLRQSRSEVVSAARSLADAANAELKHRTKQNSPSKLWGEFGDNMGQGLANGLIGSVGVVKSAVGVMAKGTHDTMTGELNSSVESVTDNLYNQLVAVYQYINSVINESTNISPVITPVVDLSQVQNGMYSAGAMLSSAGNAFGAGALSYARSNFPGSYSYGLTSQGASNVEVVRALNGVRSDLKDLGNALSAMDMVLDNGVLVGQMGTGMDRQLGTIQKFKERWA